MVRNRPRGESVCPLDKASGGIAASNGEPHVFPEGVFLEKLSKVSEGVVGFPASSGSMSTCGSLKAKPEAWLECLVMEPGV